MSARQEGKQMGSSWQPLAVTAVLVVLVLFASAARGAGLLIANGGFGGVLEIEEHAVQVTINNGIAVTEVTQVFRNTESREVEALYTFPVPKGASVANFSMWINGKEMVGEVVEKKRARRIYESYKRRKIDPGLLEQTDYKTFEMRIYPIGPGARQRVRVRYYQELDVDHDWATYVYPLATSTKAGIDSRTRGTFSLTLHAKSEVPIVSLGSPSHRGTFVAVKHDEGYWQASLETTGADLSRDVVLAYHLSRPQTGIDLIASRQGGEDGYFCLTLTSAEPPAAEKAGMDYVFILDVSGSMAHDEKLALSQNTVGEFIDAIDAKDRLEIITFNVAPTTLFRRLRPADDAAKAEARRFLSSREARGGTVLRPALSAAYKYHDPDRPLNVVVLSDGMTEQTERAALLELIRSRPAGTRVFCVGVGNEVNRPLLAQLAEDAGGLASFLSRGDDFQRQAKAFRRKLTHPVATDLKLSFDGMDVYDLEPAKLPNLYHGAPVRLYGRYRAGGQAKVTLLANVSGRQTTRSSQMIFPKANGANPEIERMWAWHRIQSLLKEADRAGRRDQAVDEVIRLGEAYSIATEYTSFIVLVSDAEYKRWRINRLNMLRLQRDRGSRQQLLAQLESMRIKAASGLGPEIAESVRPGPVLAQAPKAPAAKPQAQRPPTPSPSPSRRGWNFSFGGGPVGPIGLAIVALVAVVHWRRRRTGKTGQD